MGGNRGWSRVDPQAPHGGVEALHVVLGDLAGPDVREAGSHFVKNLTRVRGGTPRL